MRNLVTLSRSVLRDRRRERSAEGDCNCPPRLARVATWPGNEKMKEEQER